MILAAKVLSGKWISLEPLSEDIKHDLHYVAKDKRIWTYHPSQTYEDRFNRWFDTAITKHKKGDQQPFIVRRNDDKRIIGSTRYYNIDLEHRRLTIGYTWYTPDVWGTYVNPECKFLLLRHAFEEMLVNRVEFVTDYRNNRSRAALKKLGAHEEGVLRQHLILEDGFVRDTVVFSVVRSDWPMVRLKLEERLHAFK